MGTILGKFRWEGLEISVTPLRPEGPVQLTGDPYLYVLTVKNLKNELRNGIFAVSWRIDDDTLSPQLITLKDLAPNATIQVGLPPWFPMRQGFAQLRLHLYCAGKGIESNLAYKPEMLANMVGRSDQFTLYSAPVRDKKEYEAEQAERRDQRSRDILLIIIGTVAAVASTIAAVILILYH